MTVSLEQRIAAAFSKDITSSAIAALIEETETAADAADEAAEKARKRALDPTVLDPKAHETIVSTEFTRDRLRAAIPRLEDRLKATKEREYYTRWRADHDKVKIERDALAEEFRTEYPLIASKLTDLLARMAASDQEVLRINIAAPSGANLHLRKAELKARDLDSFTTVDLSIGEELRLPAFEGGGKRLWPPPTPPLWASVITPDMFRRYVPPTEATQADREEQARLQREEAARISTYYSEMAEKRREREKREARDAWQAQEQRRVSK